MIRIQKKESILKTIAIPGDKSISHRAVMFGSLAQGTTTVTNFLMGEDCLSTIDCFRKLGITIEVDNENHKVIVNGKGLHGLEAPTEILDCGNSGTTFRLLSGILAGQPFTSTLTGDASIQKRPMKRVIVPLREMGAQITAKEDNYAPVTIQGGQLKGIHYASPVASAQVKSCVLLAGLYAEGPTTVVEPAATRNHTECMLQYLGGEVNVEGNSITIVPNQNLTGKEIHVPGDISSAAFFLVAGCIVPNSEITLTNVGMNPTRTGIIDVLQMMGADINIHNERLSCNEPVADITVKTSKLKGITVEGDLIPRLIDEIPVISVAACFAEGTTVIKDAEELKVKESNRIRAMVTELSKVGAHITETEDGMIIEGGHPLTGASIETYHDHRIAMALSIAGLACDGEMVIENESCVDISFPSFYSILNEL